MMKTISEGIAEFVSGLEFDHIPPSIVSKTKDLVLDHLGVASFGATTTWGKAVAKTVGELGGREESSIYFTRRRAPAMHSALVNGTFAHGFELDDHYRGVHSGCVVIPAAIAAGEREGIDGRTLITAIVCGYEVLARLAMAMPHISDHGHHTTGTLGAFGSAVAAGKILGLDTACLTSALGLAGNFPTGLCEFYRGTMEKRVFAGRASESGILASLLARAGVTGAKTIFEGDLGFCRTFGERVALEKLLEGLGERFYTEKFYLKRYPCAGTNHPHIDAAAALHDGNQEVFAHAENVCGIVIEGGKRYRGKDILNRRRVALEVQGVMAAQYSIPYAVVVALYRGRPGVRDFSEESIADPAIQSLLRRCKVVRRERFSGMGKITVKLRDGGSLSRDVVDTNLTVAEVNKEALVDKFLDLTSSTFERGQAEEIMQSVERLEALTDVRRLTEILVPGRPNP
ncbi:MAG: MmgE/PrpD family protein [Deltaproteobacteria bacterium]|nr:MmgE/PrpD family protein [Deltaproteobacteria bacterium]